MIAVVLAALVSAWVVGALLVGARFFGWYLEQIGGAPARAPRADLLILVALTLAVGALWPYVLLVVALVRLVEGGRP